MHVDGEDAGGPNMEGCHGDQGISQQGGFGHCWPGNGFTVTMGLGAIALECLMPPVEAQSNAGGYVGDEREGDEQRLGQ